ncbi:hypothetical protein [Jatrophihabitans lederbergiae]|uniref:Uncharacterized protein n=1 Tax=Jatrophihabitans lederbergiae TaxID=3075547 RepID=A0ABU2JE03_9ACTN|nr:hypothetical protein [Jatrophihabitans sp. DSM 44399]MDT0262493.1 hypothetical protein [Jatrophihabitans sp. DSM 44399]
MTIYAQRLDERARTVRPNDSRPAALQVRGVPTRAAAELEHRPDTDEISNLVQVCQNRSSWRRGLLDVPTRSRVV